VIVASRLKVRDLWQVKDLRLVIGVATLTTVASIACGWSSNARPNAPVCGTPAAVHHAPSGSELSDGITIDRLFVTASWRSFGSGFPTKAVIHVTGTHEQLTGVRCKDGLALRFWYNEKPLPFNPPVAAAVLETTGDLFADLDANAFAGDNHGGYIFFPEPGKYLLKARRDPSVVSAAVVDVRANGYVPT
jgi:hypothetical protein